MTITRRFHGWRVVAVASLGLFLGHAPVVVFSFGFFLKHLADAFNASRAAISLAFTIQSVAAAIGVPFIGKLIDKLGARRVILTGTALFGAILIAAEWVGQGLFQLYLFFVVLGLVGGCTSPVPYAVVVSRWFDRQRGLALGVMATGLGIGAIAIPVISQRIIGVFGWRAAYAAFGCATLVIVLPVLAAFLQERRGQGEQFATPVGSHAGLAIGGSESEGLDWRQICRQRTFWLLIAAFFLAGASVHACVVHMPALLTDRGVSAVVAATASSLVGVALLFGRIGAGYLLDHVFAPRLAIIFFGGTAAGIGLLLAGGAGPAALVAAFLIGIGMGAEVDIIAYLMSRYFGLRALGTAIGVAFGSYLLAGAVGVLLMGAGFDVTRDYRLPLAGCLFAMLVAMALLSRLGPYVFVPGTPERAS
jgi:MFS family permease